MGSYTKVMNVIREYSEKIENENSIELTTYGLNYAGPDKVFDGKIHLIDLGYALDTHIQYADARLLFYNLIDGLLERLNNDKQLSDCFFNTPLTYKDLYVRLSFDYHLKGFLKKGDVSRIYILENQIGCHMIETEDVEDFQQKKVMPGVFLLEKNFLKDSVIKENPYTKKIIGRRECHAPSTPQKEQ